jgi:hypothetical protein
MHGCSVGTQLAVAQPLRAASAPQRRVRARQPRSVVRAARGPPRGQDDDGFSYGADWYEATKRLSKRKSTRAALGA